jgi:ComF family protein
MLARTYLGHWLSGQCPGCAHHYRFGLCQACQLRGALKARTSGGQVCFALGVYAGVLSERIGQLKYHDETLWAWPLGNALGQLIPLGLRHCTLVPVPLHPVRLAERGYNQSALLARSIAKTCGMSVEFDVVQRTTQTAQQARLKSAERKQNTAAAFRAGPRTRKLSSPVLLVDDVVTTGHTVDACALALEQGGRCVQGVVCLALSGSRPIG